MVQVEDLPEAIHRQMVGVPRAWVRIFLRLTNTIVCYHDTHPTPRCRCRGYCSTGCICIEGISPNFVL
jgi:hypothetical protein